MLGLGRDVKRLIALLLCIPSVWAASEVELLPAPASLVLADSQLARLQQQLDRSVAAGQYPQALDSARRLAQALASDPVSGTAALENLGLIEIQSGDAAAGISSLEQVLERLRASGNFRDPRLARPLYAIGVGYYQLKDYLKAIDYIEQANFVTRTDKGLESLEQTRHDDLLLDSLIRVGRVDDAMDRLDVSTNIQRMALKEGPELERALYKAARWYSLLEAAYQESSLHEERLEILAKTYGADSPELVPVYYDLASSYSRRMHDDLDRLRGMKSAERNVSYSFVRSDQVRRAIAYDQGARSDDRTLLDAEWKAVRALKIALRILEDQDEPDLQAIAETYVRLGDHYQLIGNDRKARRYYQRAYDMLHENGATEYLAQTFGSPVPIYQKPLKLPSTNDPAVLSAYQGEAELLLDVNSRGQPRNIEVVELRPQQASVLEDKALRYSRDTIFRPRITEDGTVSTEKMTYIYQFRPGAQP
ncbi:tetratricopeptide (TPR) repeat protein [Litorivivens lipolytica]|uniref:Tetratricopeptide (TPR) repeat protein n=1 Tax=Litorivivens lipolytica TaxID=1524264 RepID=A0A7W4Z5S8_9GAMM|nr:tetratricopeptide repeat protein [Litorivivens lipolytica]MBB3047493.1 tetratricopeptide (TPR) repeat protein [Litorivivens lipolytica]